MVGQLCLKPRTGGLGRLEEGELNAARAKASLGPKILASEGVTTTADTKFLKKRLRVAVEVLEINSRNCPVTLATSFEVRWLILWKNAFLDLRNAPLEGITFIFQTSGFGLKSLRDLKS